jgi:hypothetical protein
VSWYRWLASGVLLVCLDGGWLFLLLGVLGFLAGLGQAPLSLALTQCLLVAGALVRALHDIVPRRWPARGAAGKVLAVLAVWLAVAASELPGKVGADWPLVVLAGGRDAPGVALLALAALPAAALWHHGARRMRRAVTASRVARSFRVGLAVFVVVLLLEAGGDLDLGGTVAIAPFFAVGLAGMALAHAPRGGVGQRRWLMMVAVSVGTVVAGGLAAAVAGVAVLQGGGGALREVWLQAAAAVTAQVDAMLAGWLGSAGPGSGLALDTHAREPGDAMMLLVLLAAAAVIAWLAGRLLEFEPRARPFVLVDLSEEERESLDQDTPVRERLAGVLAARWRQRERRGAAGRSGGVLALYRRMLDLAARRGTPVNPADTPFERAAALRRDLPEVPVDAITGDLVAACYGGREPTPEVLAGHARALEAAESAR